MNDLKHVVLAHHPVLDKFCGAFLMMTSEDWKPNGESLWFASGGGFGCSKSYATRHEAITEMLRRAGTDVLSITDLGVPDPDQNRQACIAWLCQNDPNGCYTDEDCHAEGMEPMTLVEALAIIKDQCNG